MLLWSAYWEFVKSKVIIKYYYLGSEKRVNNYVSKNNNIHFGYRNHSELVQSQWVTAHIMN